MRAGEGSVADMQQKLLRVREAAQVLGVGRDSVYRLIHRGDLESIVVVNGCRRIPAEALDDYIARLRAEQASA